MRQVMIEMTEVIHNGKKVNSVGDCPHCDKPVEYIGVGPTMDGYMKGMGVKGHKGKCLDCATTFEITAS